MMDLVGQQVHQWEQQDMVDQMVQELKHQVYVQVVIQQLFLQPQKNLQGLQQHQPLQS